MTKQYSKVGTCVPTCVPASRTQRHLTGRRMQGRKKIKIDAGTLTHQIFFASILRPVVAWYRL